MRVGWPGWSIEVPDSWVITDDPECLTLEHSEIGALQFSSATKHEGVVEPDELREFSEEAWGAPSPVSLNDFVGIVFDYREDNQQWRRWFFYSGALLVFATYNGDLRVSASEIAAAEAILESLRAEG